MCDCLGLTMGHNKGFTSQASQGEASLPTPHSVHSQHIAISEQVAAKRSDHPGLSCSLHNISFPSSCTFIPRSFYLRLWAEVFLRCLCLWGRRGNRCRHIPPLWFSTSTFCPSPDPEPFSLTSESIRLPEPFVWGSLNSEMTPTSVLIHLTLD